MLLHLLILLSANFHIFALPTRDHPSCPKLVNAVTHSAKNIFKDPVFPYSDNKIADILPRLESGELNRAVGFELLEVPHSMEGQSQRVYETLPQGLTPVFRRNGKFVRLVPSNSNNDYVPLSRYLFVTIAAFPDQLKTEIEGLRHSANAITSKNNHGYKTYVNKRTGQLLIDPFEPLAISIEQELFRISIEAVANTSDKRLHQVFINGSPKDFTRVTSKGNGISRNRISVVRDNSEDGYIVKNNTGRTRTGTGISVSRNIYLPNEVRVLRALSRDGLIEERVIDAWEGKDASGRESGDYTAVLIEQKGRSLLELKDKSEYNLSNPHRNSRAFEKTAVELFEFLDRVHQKGYLHGDVKPANVIVGKKATLIDWESGSLPGQQILGAQTIEYINKRIRSLSSTMRFHDESSEMWALGATLLDVLGCLKISTTELPNGERQIVTQEIDVDKVNEGLHHHPKLKELLFALVGIKIENSGSYTESDIHNLEYLEQWKKKYSKKKK